MRPTTPTGSTGRSSARAPIGSGTVPEPRSGAPSSGAPSSGAPSSGAPSPDARTTGLIGPAWIVRTVTHVPGVLRLAGGRLAFVSTRATLFDRPLADLGDLAFPWFGFSGAFRVTVAGERLRVHVVRPAGAVSPDPALLAGLVSAAGLGATEGDAEAGPRWREVLVPARGRRAG